MSNDKPTPQKPGSQKPAAGKPDKSHGIELNEEELKRTTGGMGVAVPDARHFPK
jgi:hypothetical protein